MYMYLFINQGELCLAFELYKTVLVLMAAKSISCLFW